MIVVDLICEHEHRFEGWFASSEALEQQQTSKLLSCPMCASHAVQRLPSAPYVQTHASAPVSVTAPTPAEAPAASLDARQLLEMLANKILSEADTAEDVGEEFPTEVRRIHFGDAELRSIKGIATIEEAEALLDEGIGVLALPPAKNALH